MNLNNYTNLSQNYTHNMIKKSLQSTNNLQYGILNQPQKDSFSRTTNNMPASLTFTSNPINKTNNKSHIDLSFVQNKNNLYELSISQKRNLLNNLTENKDAILNKTYCSQSESNLIPKNKKEYTARISEIVSSIGINTMSADKKIISNYENTLKEMAQPDSEFLNTKITKNEYKLELDYPRQDFINDVLENVKDLSEQEKLKVYNHFGFEIKKHDDGLIQMNGYPSLLNNDKNSTKTYDLQTLEAINNVEPLVDKFINNNDIALEGKPKISKQLNNITGMFPEFKSIIGKKQHKTHDFTVDIHTLRVLQDVMSNPEYKTLPAKDKIILSTATLLHDITKEEGVIDKAHPKNSALDASFILERTNLSKQDKQDICKLIKTHDWLEHYNGRIYISKDEYRPLTDEERIKVATSIATDLKDNNMFKMASILTIADTKGVKEDGHFYERFKGAIYKAQEEIPQIINQLKQC